VSALVVVVYRRTRDHHPAKEQQDQAETRVQPAAVQYGRRFVPAWLLCSTWRLAQGINNGIAHT
jgi:hypothetical protein